MMTDKTENTLLDSASIQQCKQLAGNTDLQGKRAKALLEINNGQSNSVAAKNSGLTAGQVSYLLGRFKKIGMALFDAKVVKKAAVKKAAAKKATQASSKADATDTKPASAAGEPATAGDKKKKGKKSSKKDKIKKDKKGKKNKKDKKKKSKKNKK